MTEIITSRRSFLTGLGSALITAPAIVHAGSLMPVRAWVDGDFIPLLNGEPLTFDGGWPALAEVTRNAFLPRRHVQLYKSFELRKMLEFAAGA
jgi:hypothetical protein